MTAIVGGVLAVAAVLLIVFALLPRKKTAPVVDYRGIYSGVDAEDDFVDEVDDDDEINGDDIELALERSGNPFGWTVEDYQRARLIATVKRFAIITVVAGVAFYFGGMADLLIMAPLLGGALAFLAFRNFYKVLVKAKAAKESAIDADMVSLYMYVYSNIKANKLMKRAFLDSIPLLPEGPLKGECEFIAMKMRETNMDFSAAMELFAKRNKDSEVVPVVAKMFAQAAEIGANVSDTLIEELDAVLERREIIDRIRIDECERAISGKCTKIPALAAMMLGILLPFGIDTLNTLGGAGGIFG